MGGGGGEGLGTFPSFSTISQGKTILFFLFTSIFLDYRALPNRVRLLSVADGRNIFFFYLLLRDNFISYSTSSKMLGDSKF